MHSIRYWSFKVIFITWILKLQGISAEWQPVKCLPSQFLCRDGRSCVYKHKWCDGEKDCQASYDEKFCDSYSDCSKDMFQCDNGMCIPIEGRCDGYPTCSDGTDELDCSCEEISEAVGIISYSVHLGRRSEKCWRISVPSEKYLILTTHVTDCNEANITLQLEEPDKKFSKVCPRQDSEETRTFEIFGDVEIKYKRRASLFYLRGNYFNSFKITYEIVDILCKRHDAYKCSETTCVAKGKRCDGKWDCPRGEDEQYCVRKILEVPGLKTSRSLGLEWLKRQRNPAGDWGRNTHRAIATLHLAQATNFDDSTLDEDITAKQLQLQLSTAILRNGTDAVTPTQLAMYINALLVICHDPENFYGFNLVQELENQVEHSNTTTNPFPYLALCNAKRDLPDEAVVKLVQILESSSNYSFFIDMQSMALMALACVENNRNISEVKENVTAAVDRLKKRQNEDGSFGNKYTTALVMQAFLSIGRSEDKDWNAQAAVEFLMKQQNESHGSFGGFLATYLILPILNVKSLTDIGKINCTDPMKVAKTRSPVSNIQSKLGPKMKIRYYFYIGDKKDQVHLLELKAPSNITVLDAMRLAVDADSKYKFLGKRIKGKFYIHELFGIANDPEDGKFWLLYVSNGNSPLEIITKSPEEVYLKNDDQIVMWYKTAQISLE